MFTIVPGWCVVATIREPEEGASARVFPAETVRLVVGHDDIEGLFRILIRNGYDKILMEREEYPGISLVRTAFDESA